MNDKDLRRYTDLPALVYLLSEKKITLLDPLNWDDRNDSYYLSMYKAKRKLKSVLALCFTQTAERYHHWRVFAGSSSGVCIQFKRPLLLKILGNHKGIRMKAVEYLKLKDNLSVKPKIDRLPFIKRYAFKDEQEFRVIYESDEEWNEFQIEILVPCIAKITLSPWLDRSLVKSLKRMLKAIEGCHDLIIDSSKVIDNRKWKEIGDSAV